MEIAEAIIRAGIRKKYYLETRGDVLLRNKDVFRFWRKLGLEYMFIGLEAIDEEGLRKHRKRVSLGRNFEALEYARSLGIMIAINLIADPDWDHERFRIVREWGVDLPEVVNISVNTPYPGTESWVTEGGRVASRDYRLYDIQHTVMPTRLPLAEFYDELVATQRAFYRKHLGWRRVMNTAGVIAGHLMHGQTNFTRSLFLLDRVFRPELLLADHALPVTYQIPLPRSSTAGPAAPRNALYIHPPRGRKGRAIDSATEHFVEATRMGTTP
jgi:hopanoid C-3 methylase